MKKKLFCLGIGATIYTRQQICCRLHEEFFCSILNFSIQTESQFIDRERDQNKTAIAQCTEVPNNLPEEKNKDPKLFCDIFANIFNNDQLFRYTHICL